MLAKQASKIVFLICSVWRSQTLYLIPEHQHCIIGTFNQPHIKAKRLNLNVQYKHHVHKLPVHQTTTFGLSITSHQNFLPSRMLP
jgi:hypothetical protein